MDGYIYAVLQYGNEEYIDETNWTNETDVEKEKVDDVMEMLKIPAEYRPKEREMKKLLIQSDGAELLLLRKESSNILYVIEGI